jgi:hypothetical protein
MFEKFKRAEQQRRAQQRAGPAAQVPIERELEQTAMPHRAVEQMAAAAAIDGRQLIRTVFEQQIEARTRVQVAREQPAGHRPDTI